MPRRRKHSGLEDLFHFLVAMPWWIGPLVAVLVFAFLRVLIPSILVSTAKPDDQITKTFAAVLVPICTGLAPYVALLVLAIWGAAEIKKLLNRKRLDSQTGLDSIGDLSWREFEDLTAEALRRQGYEVQVIGNSAGDGGVDVVARRKNETTLVQCKHWKTWTVDVKIVRELRGVMASERADYGMVVTYGAFTADAEAFAKENRITLIGGNDLVEMIRSVQKTAKAPAKIPEPVGVAVADRPQPKAATMTQAAPACPLCGATMVRRTARKGANAGSQFWGCKSYPGCRGVRRA